MIEDQKILLVKQDVSETRQWALPGGSPESGETLDRCLIRELKEETGLDIAVKELLYITDRFHNGVHTVHILFLVEKTGGKLRSGEELQLKTEKIKESVMVPVDRLHDYGFLPGFSELIRSGFPDRGSYMGDFERFYGSL